MSPRHPAPPPMHRSHQAAKHSTPQDKTSPAQRSSRSSVSRSASADNMIIPSDMQPDPLISLGIAPHSLTRTSPALSWGQPFDPSAPLGSHSNSELARSSSSTVHNRTHSDARSDYSVWQGTAAESPADAGHFLLPLIPFCCCEHPLYNRRCKACSYAYCCSHKQVDKQLVHGGFVFVTPAAIL